MPILTDLCELPTLCCDYLVEDGDAILETVRDALYACMGFDPDADPECEAPFTSFLGYGQPVTAIPDYLCVWLEFITPNPDIDFDSRLLGQRSLVQWLVRLSLSGYPTIQRSGAGPGVENPDPVLVDRMDRVMLSLSAKAMDALGGATVGPACSPLQLLGYQPALGGEDVIGGSAGFTIRVGYDRRL